MGNSSDWLTSYANSYYNALSLINDENLIASEFPSYSDPNFLFLMENIADRFLRDVDDYAQFYKEEPSSENLELLEVSKCKLNMVREALLEKKVRKLL